MSRPRIVLPVPAVLTAITMSLLIASSAFAISYTSAGTGNFASPSTWSPPGVPGPGDDVTISGGDTVFATANVSVDTIDIQGAGHLVVQGGFTQIQVLSLTIQPNGYLEGLGSGDTVYVTGYPGATFTVQNDGFILGGSPGGSIFIHDGGPGGDLPCPNSSTIVSNGGHFEGGSGTSTGNVYLLAETVSLINTTVLGGSGSAPAGGSVYIAGIDVKIDGASLVLSGSGTAIGGSVKIVAQSCSGPGGDLYIGPGTVVDVGTPASGVCPGALLYAAQTSTILGSVAPGPGGCLYWDPPLLELVGDAELTGEKIILAGSDLDASGLASRTLPTPAVDAAGTLEIHLTGSLNLQGLSSGVLFRAGKQIRLCVDPEQVLLDKGMKLRKLMDPAPSFCKPEPYYALALNPGHELTTTPGASVSYPVQAANVSNVAGMVTVWVEDSKNWLAGGAVAVSAYLQPGEAILRTLTIDVPAGAAPGDETTVKVGGQIESEPLEYAFGRVTVGDEDR